MHVGIATDHGGFDLKQGLLRDLQRSLSQHRAGRERDEAPVQTVKQAIRDKLIVHKQYVTKHGEDLPEVRNWKWGANKL